MYVIEKYILIIILMYIIHYTYYIYFSSIKLGLQPINALYTHIYVDTSQLEL